MRCKGLFPEIVHRIAIVGSGAVGCYYGARLSAAGHDVKFLARSGYSILKEKGLTVKSPDGDLDLPSVQAFSAAEDIGPVDLVVLAWKTTSNASCREVIRPLLHESTMILTLQNGLGTTEYLAEIFGGDRVYGGLCFVCINRLAPDRINHIAQGLITIGEFNDSDPARLVRLVSLFTDAEIPCRAVEDLQKAQWIKLIWNVAFNGLCITEGGVTTAELLASAEGESRVRRIMGEVIAGATALGMSIPASIIDEQVVSTEQMGAYRPSSLIDYLEGREVELQAIWAEPLSRAEKAGARLPAWGQLLADLRARLAERG